MGREIYTIVKNANESDDFAQSVNMGCCFIWFKTTWPDVRVKVSWRLPTEPSVWAHGSLVEQVPAGLPLQVTDHPVAAGRLGPDQLLVSLQIVRPNDVGEESHFAGVPVGPARPGPSGARTGRRPRTAGGPSRTSGGRAARTGCHRNGRVRSPSLSRSCRSICGRQR
jgi:hypothetical protein